ncbi:MAG: hypothetical protein IJD53_01295 [Alistipes sp.]|nr:hypothetical protein [Alistipes sp.]
MGYEAEQRLDASNMKFGVLVVREFEEFVMLELPALIDSLASAGCMPQNIEVREVATTSDVVMATHFFAEYTDVDGVVILAPENRLMSSIPVMNGIVQLQVQWNMVIVAGDSKRAMHAVELVTMQNEMEVEAAERGQGQRGIS